MQVAQAGVVNVDIDDVAMEIEQNVIIEDDSTLQEVTFI